MEPTTLLWLGLIMAAAGLVQAAIGFAAGMVAIPLMLWVGLPLPEAIGVMSSGVLVQTTVKTWRYRHEVPWKLVWPMSIARLGGYMPGFAALYWLSTEGTAVVKPVIGGFILVALGVQLGLRIEPREKIAGYWAWVAGFVSGVTAGAVGMGAPAVVLWLFAHDWPALRARVFLWANFLMLMPVAMVGLGLIYGGPAWRAMAWGFVFVPMVLMGTWAGLWLGHQLPKQQLRWAMAGVLVLLAMTSILGPVLS
jgi:uncharacterized membrane protein YfcA